MPKSNSQRQQDLRDRRAAAGLTELRGVWMNKDELLIVKPLIYRKLKALRRPEDET